MVFLIAFNRHNKLIKLLTRVLTRLFKILKKYSYLILTPSILTVKKVRPRAVP